MDESWHPAIRIASGQLREQSQTIKDKQLELQNYQEFIEAWTHEIKTPLSLATLVLANRREEMSAYVYNQMEYVRCTINNDVDRILYYARLQADHVDYKFMKLDLSDCVHECLEGFRAISDEKEIDVQHGKGVPLEDLPFLFDKRFTGSHPDRQHATGMGLYLVKKYAEALSIDVNIESISTSGQFNYIISSCRDGKKHNH